MEKPMKTEEEKMQEYLAQDDPFYDPDHPFQVPPRKESYTAEELGFSSIIGVDEYGNPIVDPDSDFDEEGNPKRVFDEEGNELFMLDSVEEI